MELTREGIALNQVANCDVFVGKAIKTMWKRLYGGQTLAQSVVAASMTVPDDYPIHSLHGYFILAGDCEKEILFEVERIRDGRSFKTRSCKALQDGKVIFLCQISFHRKEKHTNYNKTLRDCIPEEYSIPEISQHSWSRELELTNHSFFTNGYRYDLLKGNGWKLCAVRLRKALGLKNVSWREQCSALTFLSDSGLAPLIRQMFPEVQWSMTVSLDHTIHFHEPLAIKALEWMYFYYECSAVKFGRSLGTIKVFSSKRVLLASVSQEILMRTKSPL